MDHKVLPKVVKVGCPEKVVPFILKCANSLWGSLCLIFYTQGTPGVGTYTSKTKFLQKFRITYANWSTL